MYKIINAIIVLLIAGNYSLSSQVKTNLKVKKIVIAHRGASGYLPEHTLAAKAMAYAMHSDFLEQDIVLSKDDVPIVIHDIHLDDITDVGSKFPLRKRKDGHYYVIDFTYKELMELNVFERFDPKTKKAVFPDRFPYGKSHFKLHSFQDEIEMIQGLNKSTGNTIGIYPEIKNPKFHRKEGKDISKIVLEILKQYGYIEKSDNCILQCFDEKELKRIRTDLKSNLFLVQLLGRKVNETDLDVIKTYADGIGPSIKNIIERIDKDGNITFSDLVEIAHARNLKVHAYTLRADQLGEIHSFEKLMEIIFYEANVDGAFTDFPDKVVNFINQNSLTKQ